ncbi:putative endo-1,4-beta-xylanase [Dioscorea sansibarensis]
MQSGAILNGVGLEGHFTRPNIPFMGAVLDKLATLNLPISLTEVDISKEIDKQNQVSFLFLFIVITSSLFFFFF